MRGLSAVGPSLSLRVIERDGEPWFVAKDVCEALGTVTQNVRRMLDPDEVISISVSGIRGRGSLVISESGLYRLMMRSDKAEARPFQRFVTREVLPAIRKRGDCRQRICNPCGCRRATVGRAPLRAPAVP